MSFDGWCQRTDCRQHDLVVEAQGLDDGLKELGPISADAMERGNGGPLSIAISRFLHAPI